MAQVSPWPRHAALAENCERRQANLLPQKRDPLYARIRDILESARSNVAHSVNTTQVITNWLIGREIVEEEQRGRWRADYGERLLAGLSQKLGKGYGTGFSVSSLQYMRAFYLSYPNLLGKQHAPRVESSATSRAGRKQHAPRVESSGAQGDSKR